MNPAVAAAHLEYEHERLREIAARMRALLEDRKYTGAHRIAQLEGAIGTWAWELELLARNDGVKVYDIHTNRPRPQQQRGRDESDGGSC